MKFHTNLPVRDVQATSRFYAELFDEPPVKQKADYVKFLPKKVPLNISFHQSEAARPLDVHLGFEIAERAALDSLFERLSERGLVSESREESVCCYANQDKFWVTDPDGYKWEFYILIEDTEQKMEGKTSCCGSSSAVAAPCC